MSASQPPKKDQAFQQSLDFEAADGAAEDGEALILDLDGYEGPLHVLLALARAQKVDLLKLSISKLAEQYLAFVRDARARRFALAADYLVMAAWLTYLKSRLLLPKPEKRGKDELDAGDMAMALTFRLAKLDAMRRMADALMALPRTGRDVFMRGDPEAAVIHAEQRYDVDLYALVRAYADQRRRVAGRRYDPTRRIEAYPLEDARDRLRYVMAEVRDWAPLRGVAPAPGSLGEGEGGPSRASYLASTLSAGLELVKEGELEAQQREAFAEIFLRRRPGELFEAA